MTKHTLARAAAMMCANPEFQKWMGCSTKDETAEAVRVYCGVDSRSQLDTNAGAAEMFHTLRKQFINRKEEQCK